MRRVVLRIAALGTVVALGLIAIAQAQRGTENSAPPVEEPEAQVGDASDSDSATSSKAAPLAYPTPTVGRPALAGEPRSSDTRSVPLLPPAETGIGAITEPATSNLGPNVLRNHSPLASQTAAPPPAMVATDDVAASARPPAPAAIPVRPDPFPLERGMLDGANAPEESDGPAMTAGETASAPTGGASSAGLYSGDLTGDRYRNNESPLEQPPVAGPTPLSTNPAAVAAEPNLLPTERSGDYRRLALEGPLPSAGGTSEGTGQPGSSRLEGPQTPQLVIQKFAPKEVSVGKPAKFRITVGNTGTVAATDVEISDQVPKGARLLGTTPSAQRGPRGELLWALGTIKPGDQTEVEMQFEPISEGELGSVATVRMGAEASARTIATKPQLVVTASAPTKVLLGEQITLSIEVSNPGTGVATGVVLLDNLPAGLQFPKDPKARDLKHVIGDLRPGESRQLDLTLVASRSGPTTNRLRASDDGTLSTEHQLQLEVIAPDLKLQMAGPKRRYLEREAIYTFTVENPGSASAEGIELVAYLPGGLKFVSANNSGHYVEADQTVHWQLAELPAAEAGDVELVAMPIEPGEHTIRLRGTASRGLSAEAEQSVEVEGIAAIMFEVADVTDPVEVGGETTYEIRVVNQGSKASANVQLEVALPAAMQPVDAEGPTRGTTRGDRVLFAPLPSLAPKADTTYRVRVRCLQAGDQRVSVFLRTAEMKDRVIEQESTTVYADE